MSIRKNALKSNAKIFFQEICALLFFLVLATIILAIPFGILVDQFHMHGVPVFFQVLLMPVSAGMELLCKKYELFLLVPYVLFVIYRVITLKIDKFKNHKILIILIISAIFLLLSTFLTPRLFDCDLSRSRSSDTGWDKGYYFTGEHDVCYAWVISPRDYSTTRIKEADYNTFEVLKYGYAKDNENVYYDNLESPCNECIHVDFEVQVLKGANPDTFTVLNELYAKDKNNGYCDGKKIQNSDGLSFETIEGNLAKDKNFKYKNCVIISDIN